ncbi:MAG: response regulator [Actinobacteria bacterium]|nr:MAG: response regulator [Actinomycetota bacterium]
MSPDEGPAKILIVDDEPLNLDLLVEELEDRGYLVETAENGAVALEKVAKSPPDLILLDIVMPVLDGLETCRRIKNDPVTALIPVVMMTALTAVEDRIRGIRAGADDFLSKPVDDRELMARIETSIRTKRAIDTTQRELASASGQLALLNRVDRDATAMSVTSETADKDVLYAAIAAAGGWQADGRPDLWLFVDDDPTAHSAVAARLGLDLGERFDASVAIESGSTRVSLSRQVEDDAASWVSELAGPAAQSARSLLWLAGPGQVVAGPEAARRLEGSLKLSTLPGSEAKMIEGTAIEPSAEQPTEPHLVWPDAYAELEAEVRSGWGVEGPIFVTQSLSGKSGARVYSVDITTRAFSGQAILKLDSAPHPDWNEDDEAARHRRAIELNPTFAESHFPQVVHSTVFDKWAATLSSIAGGGLEYVLPWAQVDFDTQTETAGQVSGGILTEWNSGYQLSDPVTPMEVLDSWLDYRLDPETGRVSGFLDSLGVDPDIASFTLAGRWYPNPYSFARGVVTVPGRTTLRAALGMIHGDLHGFNVLIPSRGDLHPYYLIDLAFFQEREYLFFDNAYFELAHLLHSRETTTVQRWIKMVDSSRGGSVPTGDDYGLVRIVESVRDAASNWISDHEPNRLAYMESQYALARVAAGLNFVHKRVTDQIRLLSLLYAALNLKGYLRFQGVDWPMDGPSLSL